MPSETKRALTTGGICGAGSRVKSSVQAAVLCSRKCWMPAFIWQESGAPEFLFWFLSLLFFYWLIYWSITSFSSKWKAYRKEPRCSFKNRLVSRCSSNPRTHQEFLFIIGLPLGHKKDKAAKECLCVMPIRAILLQVLMEKPQFWTHNHNNNNRQP